MGVLPHGEAQLSTADGHIQQVVALLVHPNGRGDFSVQAPERLLVSLQGLGGLVGGAVQACAQASCC